MRMFSWIHNKRNVRRHVSKKHDLVSSANHYHVQNEAAACKEEFIDWSHHGHGLLAIGTIGNTSLKLELTEKTKNLQDQNPSSPQDTSEDLTPDEVRKLQNELNLLINEAFGSQVSSTTTSLLANHQQSDQAPKYVKQSSDATAAAADDAVVLHSDDEDLNSKDIGNVERRRSVVFNRSGKDHIGNIDNRATAISKKTLSFLLKKMFALRTGFSPVTAPATLRDPISESRMEKMLKAILHKKVYPQSSTTSSTTLSAKKMYLENRHDHHHHHHHHQPNAANIEDDENDKVDNGSKWVNTDSEFIVLEI